MADPKKPQDHKSKSEPTEDYFTFSVGDDEYTMPNKTLDVITFGFIRKNRRRDEIDYVMTCLEALAGEDKDGEKILDALDGLHQNEAGRLMREFQAHLGASLGE